MIILFSIALETNLTYEIEFPKSYVHIFLDFCSRSIEFTLINLIYFSEYVDKETHAMKLSRIIFKLLGLYPIHELSMIFAYMIGYGLCKM